jgi:type IX secretion system PorP/SprF family membrane protein
MKQLLLILNLMFVFYVNAQDPNFSQFYNNPVYYNPAMTSINNGMTIRTNARNLWGPIPGRFNTFGASIEAQTVFKMGLGGNIYTDVAGEGLLRTTGGYFTYSYRPIDTKNFSLQAGLGGGFISKSIDWSRLTFSDQLDETLGNVRASRFGVPGYQRVSYADFNTGLVARFNGKNKNSGKSFKKWTTTIGVAAHHLSEPKDGLLGEKFRLPVRLLGHVYVNMLFNEVIISPGLVYEKQNRFQTTTIGFNMTNRPFTFGIWFRNRNAALSYKRYDSFIFNFGFNLPSTKKMTCRFMYGFDMTISRLKTSSYGSHEVSLVFDLDNRVLFKSSVGRKAANRTFQCPKDFKGYN